MDKEFQCCQCQQEFNLHDRNPLVLPSCGHSICQLCVTQYLQSESQLICREDNLQCKVERELKYFPINQSIIALLRKSRTNHKSHTYITPEDAMQRMVGEDVSEFSGEGQQQHSLVKSSFCTSSCDRLPNREVQGNVCPIHHKTLELVCQEDGQYICVNCALFGEHKFHNYKPIEVYVQEMEQTVSEISAIFGEVKEYSQRIEESFHMTEFEQKLNQAKEESLTKLDLKFSELFNELNQIKEEMRTRVVNNFIVQQEENKKKILTEFNDLKIEADKWLQHTGDLLLLRCNFIEKNQGKQFTIEKKVLDDGKNIAQLIIKKMKGIDNAVQYIKMQQEFFLPIENIKRQFTLEDHHKQNDQLLLDKEEKLMDSDLIYHDLKDDKMTQSNQFSQQPTQPTSPQYNMGKNSFFSQTFTPGTFDRKDRSITVLQTEPNEILPHNTNRNKLSHSKFAKVQKFSANPRMNEKILNTLSLLDKFEMVDFGQIDMTEPLINAMDEGLKGRKVVKVLKMSKCKITDDLFAKLLQIMEESSVTALHLQSNLLTEKSLDILLGVVKSKQIECKQIYMNTNAISSAKGKKKIDELKKYGIQILI